MAIYCRLQRKIDKRKYEQSLGSEEAKKNNTDNEYYGLEEKISSAKMIYRWVNAYVYGWVRYNTMLTGHIPSYRIRKILYRVVFGMKVSKGTVIFGGCEFRSPWNISLGNCVIGANCILDGRGRISVEDDVVFGSGVHIWTMKHSINDPFFRTLEKDIAQVVIRHHAWIASDSVIQPGVTVEEGCVLASKAVATKDCKSYGVYAGIPAVRISERNKDLRYKLDGKVAWHFM